MARIGFDAAKLDGLFAFENRRDPSGQGSVAFPHLVRLRLLGFRRLPGPVPWAIRAGEPHSSGAAEYGITGIGGVEFRIDRLRDLRIGHAPMLGRPVGRLHFGASPISAWPRHASASFRRASKTRTRNRHLLSSLDSGPALAGTSGTTRPISDIPKSMSSLISDNRNCYHF